MTTDKQSITHRNFVDRDSPCPGCYHKGKLTLDCDVYVTYGRGQHWFIQPVGSDEELIACDFCDGVTWKTVDDD